MQKNITPYMPTMFDISLYNNNNTFLEYYYRLSSLMISSIKFKNLPLTINERFFRTQLYECGSLLYFNDDILGNIITRFTMAGSLNIYNEPLLREAEASNGYHRQLDASNSVIIYDNDLRFPMRNVIISYARRLYDIQSCLEMNLKTQKMPFIFKTDPKIKLSLENLFKKIDGNEYVIFTDKNFDQKLIEILNTEAPFIADKLKALFNATWNEALTFIGIENANTDKKERLIVPEVESNSGNVEMSRLVRLSSIQNCLDLVNVMFDQDIQVEFNSIKSERGENIERLHYDSQNGSGES